MGSLSMNATKDSREEENTAHCPIESLNPKGESLISVRSIPKLDPQRTLISDVRRSRTSSSCQELFLPNNIHGLNSGIPKHITTLDEKYVLHCLELIRTCAMRAAAWDSASKVNILPDDVARLAVEFPLVAANEVTVSSIDDWPIGGLTNSQSMMNILKSPLLQQFGSVDFDGRKNLLDTTDTPRGLGSTLLSHKKEFTVLDHKFVSPQGHKRHLSMSTTNSTFSDKSSSSSSSSSLTSFQGMLQCTWRNGLPQYVFSVDDKREVYLANLSKVDSSDSKVLDYVYTFRKKGKKQPGSHELEFESIATMRVSTSVAICLDNNSQVRETQFVLSLSHENSMREPQNSNLFHRKNKSLTRKVANAFKSSHSYKQRSSSRTWGSSAILEDTPWEAPTEDVDSSIDPVGSKSETGYIPNLELAAIIVKDIFEHRKEADLGGWGMKFLKRPKKDDSEVISRNNGECSTSMEVLVPAGLHGGPKSSKFGPSSLTERRISGGRCDCGGWDMGCPLTILKPKSSGSNHSSQLDSSGEFKSFDLFVQGSKQDHLPMMKMVNIHEGLHYIHFQSALSTLQSFAIAAAIIHSHSPVLRSKVYRS